MLAAASGPLRRNFFDTFVISATLAGRVSFKSSDENKEKKLTIFRTPENSGCYHIPLSSGTVNFGTKFDLYPILDHRLKPFMENLETLNRQFLRDGFSSIADVLAAEITVAQSLKSDLVEIKDAQRQWDMHLYIANYGESAMMVTAQATLEVWREGTGGKLETPCHLAEKIEHEGEWALRSEPNGLLLPAGESREIAFITTQVQGDMEMNGAKIGGELAAKYKDGGSNSRIRFQYISAGLRQRKSSNTPTALFRETD